jgi:hypothetical protein
MKLCDYCKKEIGKFIQTSGKICCRPKYQQCNEVKKKTTNIGNKNGMFNRKHSLKSRSKMSAKANKKFVSIKTRSKMSSTKKMMFLNGELNNCFEKGQIPWNLGKEFPNLRGDNNPSKRPEVRKKISISKIGDKNPSKRLEVRRKISKKVKERFLDKEWLKKFRISCSKKPNKMEKLLFDLLEETLPGEYEFVGDYKIWIEGKNPDFINKDKSKIIEFFGDYWHRKDEEKPRILHFKNFGFDSMIIWEHELKNTNKLINKIKEFNSNF